MPGSGWNQPDQNPERLRTGIPGAFNSASNARIGAVNSYPLDEFSIHPSRLLYPIHDPCLRVTVPMVRSLGANLQQDISIVATALGKVDIFSQELSPEVVAAIPEVARLILDFLIESRKAIIIEPNDLIVKQEHR